MFGSNQSGGAPDLIVTSSNSGLQGQEGLDRTAMDIQVRNEKQGQARMTAICCQVFARGGEREAGQGGHNQRSEAEVEIEEIDIEDSEEGGVSSIVSSSGEQGAGRQARARQAITWGDTEAGVNTGTTSSSPQRQAVAQVRDWRLSPQFLITS